MGLLDFIFGEDETTSNLVNAPGKYQEDAQHFALGLAQRSQVKAEELWGRYAETYAPYEDKVIKANSQLVQPSVDLQQLSIQNQKKLLGPATDFTLANIESQTKLMPFRDEATKASLQLTTEQATRRKGELEASQGVSDKFYEEAGIGAEALTERRVGQAVAGVEGAYKGAEQNIADSFSQFGIDPSSGSFKSAIRKVAMDKARSKSGATMAAREGAERESFNRLSAGMNARAGTFAQPGVAGPITPSVPLQPTGVAAGPGMTDPVKGSTGAGSVSAYGVSGLSGINSGSTTTTKGGDNQVGTGLGVLAGLYAT